MSQWFGSGWPAVTSVAAATALIYVLSLIALRVAGRRTVARMSAFDFVVTVAIGSIIATTVVNRSTPFINGFTAIIVLLILQTSIGALRQHSDTIRRLVDFRPVVVYEDRNLDLPGSPFGPQPTKEELESKLRHHGLTDWESVDKVVIEPDGKVSVILRS